MMDCPAEEVIKFQPIPSDLKSLVDELFRGKDMKKQGAELYDNARKALAAEIPQDSEGFGLRLIHVEKKGSIDWAAFRKAHPDLDYDKFRKPASSEARFNDKR
jgi:hypothetical protein